MKNILFLFLAFVVLAAWACNGNNKHEANPKLIGNWISKDGETKLQINSKQFILDNGEPIPEDYFMKGDTILTSFEGNQPYTKFLIKKLNNKELSLMFPDSVLVEFKK